MQKITLIQVLKIQFDVKNIIIPYLKMTSMGDLKNNLQILKKHLLKMNLLESLNLKLKDIQQPNLRAKNPQIFLQFLSYLITEYSTALYKQIIIITPDIKLSNDKKFVESCYSSIRQIFQYRPTITVQQFLNYKYFELKVQFLAQLCKLIFQWQISQRGKGGQKQYLNNNVVVIKKQYQDEQFEYEQPKKIVLQASKVQKYVQNEKKQQKNIRVQIGKSINNQINVNNQLLIQKKQNIQKVNKKQNQRSIQQLLQEQSQQQINKQSGYVKQQQFKEYLKLLQNLGETVNAFGKKFEALQSNVLSWVNNTNARIVILQQNVKLLKNNL